MKLKSTVLTILFVFSFTVGTHSVFAEKSIVNNGVGVTFTNDAPIVTQPPLLPETSLNNESDQEEISVMSPPYLNGKLPQTGETKNSILCVLGIFLIIVIIMIIIKKIVNKRRNKL